MLLTVPAPKRVRFDWRCRTLERKGTAWSRVHGDLDQGDPALDQQVNTARQIERDRRRIATTGASPSRPRNGFIEGLSSDHKQFVAS